MWTSRSEPISGGRVLRVAMELDSLPVAYAEVLRLWQHDGDFRSWFVALLAETPFAAFRWETPPVTAATASRSFEFVVLAPQGSVFRGCMCGSTTGPSITATGRIGRALNQARTWFDQ